MFDFLKKKEFREPSKDLVLPPDEPIFTPPSIIVSGNVDATKYVEHLKNVIDQNNIEGPDFLEFSKALENMNGLPLNEQQKITNAFSILATTGLTKEHLISTGNQYLTILDKESSDFKTELQAARNTKIDSKQTEIQKLTAENEEFSNKIQANIQKIAVLNSEIQTSSLELSSNESAFNQAFSQIKNQITNLLTSISNYLS